MQRSNFPFQIFIFGTFLFVSLRDHLFMSIETWNSQTPHRYFKENFGTQSLRSDWGSDREGSTYCPLRSADRCRRLAAVRARRPQFEVVGASLSRAFGVVGRVKGRLCEREPADGCFVVAECHPLERTVGRNPLASVAPTGAALEPFLPRSDTLDRSLQHREKCVKADVTCFLCLHSRRRREWVSGLWITRRLKKCRRGSDRGLEASPFTAGTSIESGGPTLPPFHSRLWPRDTKRAHLGSRGTRPGKKEAEGASAGPAWSEGTERDPSRTQTEFKGAANVALDWLGYVQDELGGRNSGGSGGKLGASKRRKLSSNKGR